MRFILAFALFVATMSAASELSAGHMTSGLLTLGVACVIGVFFWRNLRDPEVTRRKGERVKVTFNILPADAVKGTDTTHFGTVRTFARPRCWHVAMVEGRKPGEVLTDGDCYRGWVWLDPDGHPECIKSKAGMTWSIWNVVKSAPTDP